MHAENTEALSIIANTDIKVHLVYMDPPFATGKTQTGTSGSYSDSASMHDWSTQIFKVARLAKDILHESGSIVLHCDWRTNVTARSILDLVFGFDAFASEIIWSYKRWPAKTNNFQRTHDTLLRYVRCQGKQRWNQLYQPLAESTLASFGSKSQKAQFEAGKRKRSVTLSQDSPGAPLGDVWDIPILAPISKERTGYPTQKPEALLERLILSCTNEGDTVLDPYAGSGTSIAVANRLKRNWIAIDQNIEAIEVIKKRICC